tara:strand:- start:4886 stop:5374 length:489 start_codon:yes stop_codon:yes gene_type:complete
MADEWKQPDNPPPPMFLGEKERNLVKQVNDEILERVVGQQVLYYAIDIDRSNFHPLYGEAIEKTFLPPVRVYALVEWGGRETGHQDNFGVEVMSSITVNFHNRRLTEDQDLYVREGDFVLYAGQYYEIVALKWNKFLFGQDEHYFQIQADCIRAREGLFDAT